MPRVAVIRSRRNGCCGAFVASPVLGALRTSADGADHLQHDVPLVRRAVDGRAGLGRDGVHQEPRAPAAGRHCARLSGRDPGGPSGQAAAVGRALLCRWNHDRSLGQHEELPSQGRLGRAASTRSKRRNRLSRGATQQSDACLDHGRRRAALQEGSRPGCSSATSGTR